MKTQQMHDNYSNTSQQPKQNTYNRTVKTKNCLSITQSANMMDGMIWLVRIFSISVEILITQW